MVEINGEPVIGKCKFCSTLITKQAEHHFINRGMHIYYICPRCYNDLRKVTGGKINE